MHQTIEKWIDQTLDGFSDKRQSCVEFKGKFSGCYSADFLSKSYFVVVDEIPKPNFPELRVAGFGDFIDMPVDGITYKDTYFVLSGREKDLPLHFHELVHVAQWEILGAQGFIERYMLEILTDGYESAPLEKMAYDLQALFEKKKAPENIPEFVERLLNVHATWV